jgi:hypothetical protein
VSDAASTESVMHEVRDRVRAELHKRLAERGGAEELADRAVFDEVDALFRRGLTRDRADLLLPALMAEPWRPELSLRLSSHRAPSAAAPILFVKKRLLQPMFRWLFEYSQGNFRRQDHLNQALVACLQSLAADHARLKQRVAVLEGGAPTATGPAAPR